MKHIKLTLTITAVAGLMAVAPSPAGAAPLAPGTASALSSMAGSDTALTQVQYRRHDYHHGPRRGWRDHRRHRHHGDDGAGAAVAAGVIGLAIGAIAAGAAQQQNNAVAYCSQRFRSYDPASGTYLGYDGFRHPCP
jgi:hypothetical protein